MDGRKLIAVECFKGEKPSIILELRNAVGEEFQITLRVDTGFDGPILLSASDYTKFECGELPEESWFIFRTLNGNVVMRTSRATMNLKGKKIETYVLSPRDFEGKNLVGLEVLKATTILVDKASETCFVNGM